MEQINEVNSNNDQGRVYQSCKFHDTLGRDSCARVFRVGKRGMVKIMYYLDDVQIILHLYSADFVFYLFYDGHIDMQIWFLLTKILVIASKIVKIHGLKKILQNHAMVQFQPNLAQIMHRLVKKIQDFGKENFTFCKWKINILG